MDGSAAPIDDSILELLTERARTHPLAETVRTEYTSGILSLVVVKLDRDRYPDRIQMLGSKYSGIRMETIIFTTLNAYLGWIWQCRGTNT